MADNTTDKDTEIADAAKALVLSNAAVKQGLINGKATVDDVMSLVSNSSIGTLGYAIAWEHYVAVCK
ncbi:hypothetical protein ACFYE8_12335 [Rhizobium leguminosarum]|uniref:hypothetical protein n=1 Tax=Rhizobium leguminosarum TaxID=384 RepID=UPI0036DEE91E